VSGKKRHVYSSHSKRKWSYTQTYPLAKIKPLNYAIFYDFEIFKVMSHNLELFSF